MGGRARSPLWIALAALAAAGPADALGADDQLCKMYKTVFPSLYKAVCSGARKVKPSGAASTISESFNRNPSSAPTDPTPYGLETISSYLRQDGLTVEPTFTVIKGFQRFGTGVSTASNSTFYGNDVIRRSTKRASVSSFKDPAPVKGRPPNVNLGTAFVLNPVGAKRGLAFKLGASARYNNLSNKVGWGSGVSMGNGWLLLSAGIAREKVSGAFPWIIFPTASLTVRIPFLELEYAYMESISGPNLSPIHVVTATVTMGRVVFTGAQRRLDYFSEGSVRQNYFGVQVYLAEKIALGYLVNYIPGTNAGALQIFL